MKYLRIFILVLFFASNLFSQSWNNIINNGLSTGQAVGADVFSNSAGINVLYSTFSTGEIHYVLLSSSGTIIKQVQIDSDGYFPIIIGDNNNLFAIYVKNSSLIVKMSTNLFTSWTDISPPGATNIPVTLSPSDRFQQSGIESGSYQMFDAVYRDLRLHVAWTETVNNLNEAYYSQYYLTTSSWIFEREEITSDYIGEKGGRPRIAILPTHLLLSYNLLNNYNLGTIRTRYREIDGPSWSSSVNAFIGNSAGEDISSDNTYIHLFYYQWQQAGGNIPLYHKKIPIGNSNWGTGSLLANNVDTWNGVKCSKTVNGIFNMSYITFQISTPASAHLIHRSFSNNTWSTPYSVSSTLGYSEFFGFSTVSNDLYFSWFNRQNNVSALYYRQYDAFPLAPQNLAVQIYTLSNETYPKLTWSFNNEPDVFIKTNAYQISRRYSLSGGAWSAWTIIGYSDGNESEYIDYSISGLYAESNTAEYKLRVRDYTNQFSDFSSAVSINFSQFNIYKLNNGIVQFGYELDQNYPNPFNPNTKISFSIKEEGLVTLKVYDILGKEVATLVNENKPEGIYETDFDASTLPSGMYIYKLQAGSFTDVKKMLLTK